MPPGVKAPAPKKRVAPAAPTDSQLATQQVSAAFDPVLKQITDAFNQRAVAQQSAITGYSKTLADLMGHYAPEARAAYGGAAAGQSAIDASLAATREGQGAGAQADLARRLAEIHASPETASRIAGGFTGDLAGEANATAARGGANLAMLLGEGAHAQDYGAKLPGIAAGIGLGATERAQGQITNEMRTALSELAAKRPDAFQAALANISSTRQKQEQLNLENGLAIKKYGLDVTKTGASIDQGNARIGIAQQNANTAAARAQTAAQAAAAKAAAKANPSLTPNQAVTLAKKAAVDAQDLYHGKQHTTAAGQTIIDAYTVPYKEAILTLSQRYPTLGRAAVLKLVNSWYPYGKYGRPAKPVKALPNTPTGPTLAQAGK